MQNEHGEELRSTVYQQTAAEAVSVWLVSRDNPCQLSRRDHAAIPRVVAATKFKYGSHPHCSRPYAPFKCDFPDFRFPCCWYCWTRCSA